MTDIETLVVVVKPCEENPDYFITTVLKGCDTIYVSRFEMRFSNWKTSLGWEVRQMLRWHSNIIPGVPSRNVKRPLSVYSYIPRYENEWCDNLDKYNLRMDNVRLVTMGGETIPFR
jgi:hypothetical protein